MKIYFTVNLAIQFSLILNEQKVENRLLSFEHFSDGKNKHSLAYYHEHGHFEPGSKSKYKHGLNSEKEKPNGTQSSEAAGAAESGQTRRRIASLRSGVDAHPARRRIRDGL